MQRLLREGGGQLSDDIPPPTADEREEAAAGAGRRPPQRAPELPMPGLAPLPALAARTGRAKPDPEVERLRALLAETLRELEELRALLP